MADLGAITEFVNAEEFTLEVGSDIYIGLENLVIKIGNTEDRATTHDFGPSYFYGMGDNFFTATLKVTSPELSSLNTLTQKSTGTLTSTAWKIVSRDLADATKTFAATGFLRDYAVRKGTDGKVLIDIFVRINGDTVTIS